MEEKKRKFIENGSTRDITRKLLIAATAMLLSMGCDKPGTEPIDPVKPPIEKPGEKPGEKPFVADSRTNAAVQKLIYDYITETLPGKGYMTYEEAFADLSKYVEGVSTSKQSIVRGTMNKSSTSGRINIVHLNNVDGLEVKSGCENRTISKGLKPSESPNANSFFHEMTCK